MKVKTIIKHMENWAPKSIIDSWDNTGFQIGSGEKDVENILVSLDLDQNILEKAIKKNIDLIITHHPIIFKPISTIVDTDPKENLIIDIIKNDIAVYNAHSNLDLAIGGVSHILAEKLNIFNTSNLRSIFEGKNKSGNVIYGYGRIGEISKTPLKKYINLIKKNLNIDNLILYGNINKTVKKVAVCGGSGSDFIKDAVDAGADLYITGDIKYHEAQFAYEEGLTLIDVGHFHSEKHILPVIKKYIDEEFDFLNVEVLIEESVPTIIY